MPPSVHVLLFSPHRRRGATRWPTSRLGSTHPALNVLPLSHHASFCPTSLLLCHQPLFVLSLCFFSPLCVSLRLPLLMFPSPLQLLPHVSSLCLCMSQLDLLFLLSGTQCVSVSLHSLHISLMRTLHRLKLMSSPSLSELGKSEKSSPEDRGEKQKRAGANATWNRYSKCHQGAENEAIKMHFEQSCRPFGVCVMLQHSQCRHSSLPEERFGR